MIWRFLTSLYFFLSISGLAKDRVTIASGKQTARITFRSENSLKGASLEAWNDFCDRLGKQLSLPGPGFLSSYSCQTTDSPQASPSPSWHLELIENRSSLEVKLHFLMDGRSQDIQSLSFPTQGSVLDKLDSEVLPVALAIMLVETSPTGWAYKHKKDGPSFRSQGGLLTFPQDLLVYRLYYEKKERLWIPSLYAHISKVKDRESLEDKERITYAVDVSYRPLQIGKGYWVKSLDNEERQRKYQDIITAILQGKSSLSLTKTSNKNIGKDRKFIDDYGDLRSRSYAGFRFGKAISQSHSIITQVNMLSILAEIGSGPLAGLRGYYDLFPEMRRGSGDDLESFRLRRASIGWAFSFKPPSFIEPIFSKIDLQPKIGLLDLKAHLHTITLDGESGLDFHVKNTYDLALEIGLEKIGTWFRSRLWGGFSTANFGVSSKTAVTVKSVRGGMDLYFYLFEAGQWDVNLLTFASIEKLEITKDPKSLDPNTPGLYSVSPKLFYAGLGLTLSW